MSAYNVGRLDYIIDKIETAPFVDAPFRHIYIEDLFNAEDFAELISQPEIDVPVVDSDKALIDMLERRHFEVIGFPGTTTDKAAYLTWHADPAASNHSNKETCEGYGVVMRLRKTTPATILDEANTLFESDRFWDVVSAKFRLKGNFRRDYGLQKYLDGYEISPHPDIRSKALTFMLSVNPAANSEELLYHTQYLKFRPEYDYVRQGWENSRAGDRAWVSWDWCETQKTQTKNNSIVMFSPGNDTLHAVKASYDHLQTQRTQFYGNLWYQKKK